jgi:hypothetical protein
MKIIALPKTRLGKCSLWFFLAFVILFITFQLLVVSGQRGGETFKDNLILSVPILLAGISGISGFVTGLVGIIKSKERSILVFFSTIIGLFVLIFVIGELAFPH